MSLLLLFRAGTAPAPTPAPTPAPEQAGGGYEDEKKRKPRFIIEVDGRQVEFRSERAAKAALRAQDKPAPAPVVAKVAKPISPAPKPVVVKVQTPEYDDDEEEIEMLLLAL